jgi:hypothetical protein
MRQIFCIKLTNVSCVIAKWSVAYEIQDYYISGHKYTHTQTYAHHNVSVMTGNRTDFGTALLLH